MNLVAFGLILICCHAWAIEIDDNFRSAYAKRTKLEDFLEKFKSSIKNGDENLGIPPLDPCNMTEIPVNVGIDDINLKGLLTNVNVVGLSSYIVNSANFKLIGLKTNMDLTWPLVVANTNYTIKGEALGFDIYGTGHIYLAAHDFKFHTDISFTLKGQHIQIKQLSTKISLRALDFEITGLYDDEETSKIISKTVSDMVPKFIDENQQMIQDNINHIFKEKFNEILMTITLKDLLKMIGL